MTGLIFGGLNYGAIGALNVLGLTAGLKLCLDAGDSASLPAASTNWRDLSGGGYDFHRGTTSGADATDPSINGTAGGLSVAEYLGFDGGDYLTYDSANETWMENFHKNNAKFTIAGWLRSADVTALNGIIGDCTNVADKIGIEMHIRTDGTLRFSALNGSGIISATQTSVAAFSVNTWTFFASQVDEAAGTGLMQVQATQEAKSITYSSPSAASASFSLQIGSEGNADRPMPSGGRIAVLCAWEGASGALTAAQLMALFNATRGRFGI